MLYLLDANVLIDANRDYYPIDRVPEFWEWLVNAGVKGLAKIPIEVYEEIKEGKIRKDGETGKIDELAKWAKEPHVREALLFSEEASVALVSGATNTGYAPDLTDDEVEKIGRDPFLVAYALFEPTERCIVTTEVSKPTKTRANRHLPDVCKSLGVKSCNTFEFVRALDFKTNWKAA